MTRTIFIGDVHGCFDELMSLCKYISLTPDDHIYFAWDLINKWPKSLEVLDFVRNRPNTWSVMGNHEFFTVSDDVTDVEETHLPWIENHRMKTGELRKELDDAGYTEWLRSLPVCIERDEFILVHGGVHPEYGVDTPAEIATLLRMHEGRPWYEYYTWAKLIIYGHWAAQWLRVTPHTIGLDTGCCFWWHLTAYCLETRELWQVRANAVYKNPVNWGFSSDD